MTVMIQTQQAAGKADMRRLLWIVAIVAAGLFFFFNLGKSAEEHEVDSDARAVHANNTA